MIEKVLKDIKSLLTTNIATEITRQETYWATQGDAVDLDDIGSDQIYIGRRFNVQKLPAIFIYTANYEQQINFNQFKFVDLFVNVGLIDQADDTNIDILEKKIWRTTRAMVNVFETSTWPNEINVQIDGITFSEDDNDQDLFDAPDNFLIKQSIISLLIKYSINSYKPNQI